MLRSARVIKHSAKGFSLIEILVGVLIGMLTTIVIAQVFALAEGQKRTTTGTSDALNEGVSALYALQRDIGQAGYGTSTLNLFGCSAQLPIGVTIPLAPVIVNPANSVIPAGDANTDRLLVVYGNPDGETQGLVYNANTANLTASHYYIFDTPCAPSAISTGVVSLPSSGTIYDLGNSPVMVAYAVRGGNLTMCNFLASNCSDAGRTGDSTVWVPVASNIVSLRVQYGRDTSAPMDGIVDVFDQTQPATQCGWARVSAVRLALVARSAQLEKTAVTAAAPTWEGGNNPSIDLTANPTWQNYRYRVFQTVIPIRNVAWLGAVAGC